MRNNSLRTFFRNLFSSIDARKLRILLAVGGDKELSAVDLMRNAGVVDYALLRQLERQGYLTSRWEGQYAPYSSAPRRKFYRRTDKPFVSESIPCERCKGEDAMISFRGKALCGNCYEGTFEGEVPE